MGLDGPLFIKQRWMPFIQISDVLWAYQVSLISIDIEQNAHF